MNIDYTCLYPIRTRENDLACMSEGGSRPIRGLDGVTVYLSWRVFLASSAKPLPYGEGNEATDSAATGKAKDENDDTVSTGTGGGSSPQDLPGSAPD